MKLRAGRGFTPNELKIVGLTVKGARTIGIAVDTRRKNRSEEKFELNVQRLKSYLKRIVILDKKTRFTMKRNPSLKEKYSHPISKMMIFLPLIFKIQIKSITSIQDVPAYATLRHARHNLRQVGNRLKKSRENLK